MYGCMDTFCARKSLGAYHKDDRFDKMHFIAINPKNCFIDVPDMILPTSLHTIEKNLIIYMYKAYTTLSSKESRLSVITNLEKYIQIVRFSKKYDPMFHNQVHCQQET